VSEVKEHLKHLYNPALELSRAQKQDGTTSSNYLLHIALPLYKSTFTTRFQKMSGSGGNVYAILVGIKEYILGDCTSLGSLENVRLVKELLSHVVKITEMIILTSPTDSSLGSTDIPDRQTLL
jgi:hypothetical protein